MNDKLLGLLGIARRSGQITMGHDMAMCSVMQGNAKLVLICNNSSQRLVGEFERATQVTNKGTKVLILPYSIDVMHKAVGYKAGVFSINDQGFATKMEQLLATEGDQPNT